MACLPLQRAIKGPDIETRSQELVGLWERAQGSRQTGKAHGGSVSEKSAYSFGYFVAEEQLPAGLCFVSNQQLRVLFKDLVHWF